MYGSKRRERCYERTRPKPPKCEIPTPGMEAFVSQHHAVQHRRLQNLLTFGDRFSASTTGHCCRAGYYLVHSCLLCGMRRVLVVWHSRTGLARAMADALEEGASLAATGMDSELVLVRRSAGEATVEDLLSSDGYLFCAPENLAMVSGEMAEFFQRNYYHVFDTHESSSGYGESSRLLGRPCALLPATATYCHIVCQTADRGCALPRV